LSELARVNRSAAAGALSASIAHEVNQPLTAIVSNGSAALRWLQRNTPNYEEAITALRAVVSDGHRAGEIVAAVRAMFRAQTTEKSILDLNELVREVLMLLRADIEKNDIVIRNELTEHYPRILVERTQLQQVILNLVMNAVEAIGSVATGPRVLCIRADARGAEMRVFVEDSGPGINQEDISRVFDSFFTTKPGGMGMGLAICKSIIEAAGGRLQAQSNDWGGATFCLTLPYHCIEAA
jgi:C4-dicarboxylate-specific signal transduction histidine kinase